MYSRIRSIAYGVGALGCTLATWWLFRAAGRAWVHFFVITVMVLLFTPFAIDAEHMTMAPALFSLTFGFLDGGLTGVKPIIKLLLGIWAGAQVLSLIYQLLTRRGYLERRAYQREVREAREKHQAHNERAAARQAPAIPSARTQPHSSSAYDPSDVLLAPSKRASGLSREERSARDELLSETPIRALR